MVEKSVGEGARERGYVDLEAWMGKGSRIERLEIVGRRCKEAEQ